MFRSNIASLTLAILPASRLFVAKARILQFLGYPIAGSSRFTKNIRIFGRGELVVGQASWIGIGCEFHIAEGSSVVIGNDCDIGPGVRFVTGSHEIGTANRRAGVGTSRSIEIGSGCWIGAYSTVLGGCNLGAGSVIGAGTVLKGEPYPDSALIAGVPGSVKKRL